MINHRDTDAGNVISTHRFGNRPIDEGREPREPISRMRNVRRRRPGTLGLACRRCRGRYGKNGRAKA